jgi:hypothetical protein
MHGMYECNVKLVKAIFHRCKIYPSFPNESSEKIHETQFSFMCSS